MNKDYICSVDGCQKKVHARGYCTRHYGQVWRTGKVEPPQPQRGLKRMTAYDLHELDMKIVRAEDAYSLSVGLEARLRWSRKITDLKRERRILAYKLDQKKDTPTQPVKTLAS